MISRNFYARIVLRSVSISLTALALAFTFFKEYYILAFILLIVLVSQTVFLVKYVNFTNRKIAYFFRSIKNEDFTLRFPEYGDVKSLNELNRSLNLLNGMIQEVYLKNQAQEKYYQEILKQAEIGILTFNAKGHIFFANPRVEKLLNYTPLNHIKQLTQVDDDLYALFSELKPFDRRLFKLTNERETSELVIKSTEITLNGKALNLVTVQDINNELDEKETDSWVKLIRVLTHEIMNTIAPITSISESILNYHKDENGTLATTQLDENQIKNTVKGLEVIKNQGGDLMNFVQSYRSFLNVPAPDKKIISVDRLLEKVMVVAGQQIESQIILFEIISESKGLEIFADETQITQVLVNLTKNAIQALRETADGQIKLISGINTANRKYIIVKDNGPGIAPDMINQVFVPFFTTKNDGTGIGLSLSKQIMQLHGGSLKAHSIPNTETAFTLVF